MCLYLCMFVNVFVAYVCICSTNVRLYVCMYLCIRVRMYVCMYLCLHLYMYACIR